MIIKITVHNIKFGEGLIDQQQSTTRPCLVMSPYLIKVMRKFYVFNNIIHQKYEPTRRSIYSLVCYQFAIYFYVGSICEESTEDMEKKNCLCSPLLNSTYNCWKNTRSIFEFIVFPQSRGQGPDSC